MTKSKYLFFLSGLFVSALGSNAFVLSIVNILKDHGMVLGFLGLFVAINRFTSFLTQMIFGKIGDQVSPVIIVCLSEVGAALSSIVIFSYVDESGFGLTNKGVFLLFGALRLFFVSLQFSSIQKIAKTFDSALDLKGSPAIHLTLVNNLALFVMGCFTFIYFKQLNLKMVLVFDAITFLFNGAFILFIPKTESFALRGFKLSLRFDFREYYFQHKTLFLLDILLCLALFGANILNLKLLSDHINWIPILTTSFGLAGVIASLKWFQSTNWYEKNIIWIILATSLAFQGYFYNQPEYVLIFSVIRNFTYWLLFNSISKRFMNDSSIHNFAAVSSSRQATIVGTLSCGELITGNFTFISVPAENLLRSSAAIIPTFFKKNKL